MFEQSVFTTKRNNIDIYDASHINTLQTELVRTQLALDDVEDEVDTLSGPFVTVGTAVGSDYICDGVADDVQIQAAIDAVTAAGGGVVFIRKGTYVLSTTVYMRASITLMGAGQNVTILQAKAAWTDNLAMIETANSPTYCIIRSLTLDGNKANQTTQDQDGIGLYSGSGHKVLDVDIKNLNRNSGDWAGIYITAQRCVIERCRVYDCETHGIYVGSGKAMIDNCYLFSNFIGIEINSSEAYITNCDIESSTSHGLYVTDSYVKVSNVGSSSNGGVGFYNLTADGCSFNACTAISNTSFGFQIDVGNSVFTGCKAISNGNSGFYSFGTNNTFSGCMAQSNLVSGFQIAGNYNAVSGCICESNVYGILVSGNYNSISGNNVRANTQHGIYLGPAVVRNSISSNVVNCSTALAADNTYSGIFLTGTCLRNTVIGNNIFGDGGTNDLAYCIREAAAADNYNLFVGNTALGADTAQISTQGANSVSANNITT